MNREGSPVGRGRKVIILLSILVVIPSGILLLRGAKHTFTELPYLGYKEVNGPGDTTYWSVPGFTFTDENGKTVTQKDFEGKVLVVDFFFTRCATICPKMTAHMQQIQLELTDPDKAGTYSDVALLSHTVDPLHDTPEVLRAYARQHEADTTRWHFLTGDASAIYRQGNTGYLLNASLPDSLSDQFLHDEHFALVDKRRHIRGFYDGTSENDMGRLMTDLKMLLAEERRRAREAREAKQ